MKKLRWQILIVVLALVAIGVLLVSQQPTILPGVDPEPEPVTGGLYTEALIGKFGRLNPLLDYSNPTDQDINRLLYSALIRFDERGVPRGDLVESWGISQDGTVYNVSIRANATWHDGDPVTSEDVLFTIDLMREDGMPIPEDIQAFWDQVEIVIFDDNNLQFRLPEPFAPFLDYLTFGVVPQHLLDGLSAEEIVNADFNLNPIGSGPYQFQRLLTEQGNIEGVLLSIFDAYYGDVPFIEEIIFLYYPDLPTAFDAYQQEEVMGISRVDAEILSDALQEPGLNLYSGRMPQLSLVYLNLDDPSLPFFQESEVRRALLMGINRQKIINEILDGQGIIAHGPILSGTWAYYEGIEKIPYDLDGAVKILKEADYTIPAGGGGVRAKEGVALAFELVYQDEEPFSSIANSIRKDWEKIGVKAVLRSVSQEELVNDYLEPRNFDTALVNLNLGPCPDPDPYPFWHQAQTTGGQNYAMWDDRQASEYIEKARVDVDFTSRRKWYRNFQVRFTQEMPALPLFNPVYSYGVDEHVQGVQMGPVFTMQDRFNTISDWFLLARRTLETSETPTPVP